MIDSIEMIDISKQFPLVRALNHVSLTLHGGEIHSLLGENGAGKTCLMKILYGMMESSEGKVLINGEEVKFRSPADAISRGIGMVHQHFMLSPVMSVTENIIVNAEPRTKYGLIDRKKAREEVQSLIDKFNFQLDPDKKIQQLSVGEQQRVEILKALYRGAEILILDEPTAVLTPQEVDALFVIMRNLKTNGTGIIIITHKLKETLAIADTISVLRDGHMVRERESLGAVTSEDLARMMVGRDVELNIQSHEDTIGEDYFFIKNCSLTERGIEVLKNINLTIRKGEILGIAGVEGNGQSEFIEVLTGLRKPTTLTLMKGDEEITGDAKAFIESGIGHIPEDRLTRGLIPEFTIEQNEILGYQDRPAFTAKGFLRTAEIEAYTEKNIKEYKIKTPNGKELVSSLSGGNQQKVVVSRVIEQDPDVLIVAQPTRGVDVGAMEYIHHRILDLKKKGKAVLLISADLDEVYNLSDRIAVMYSGEIVAVLDKKATDQLALGLLMTGGGK
jgi:ABC-type uncharacterized transport systems, ATPase components